jgi:hypothetical protein
MNKSEVKLDNKESIDMRTVNDSLTLLSASLDKGCSKGAYTLDEAFNIRLSLNNVTKVIEILVKKINEINDSDKIEKPKV